jgi:hypothetical protein
MHDFSRRGRDDETAVVLKPSIRDLDRLHRLPPIDALDHDSGPARMRAALAGQRLAAACMARQGYRYAPAPPEPAEPVATTFGLETAEPAAGETSQPAEPSRDPAFGRALLGRPEARVTAHGRRMSSSAPAEGCIAEAERTLLGPDRIRWMQLELVLFEAQQDARRSLDRDPAFRTATADWQRCMRRAGVPADDPVALVRTLPARADPRQQPAVRADLACKVRTGYLAVAYSRLAAAQQAVLDPRTLVERRRIQQRQDAVAADVLRSGEAGTP